MQVDGFDEQIGAMEDWDLWLRLTADSGRFAVLPEPLARYRVHGPSNSSDPNRMHHGRMRALDKLFRRVDLAPELRLLEGRAWANALVQSSAALYAVGREDGGKHMLIDAVRHDPRVLASYEPYYAVACAEQPVGHKATSYPMDLKRAESRLMDALNAAITTLGWTRTRALRRLYGRAYRVLARCAALQRSRGALLQYSCLAALHDFTARDILTGGKALVRSITWEPRRRLGSTLSSA